MAISRIMWRVATVVLVGLAPTVASAGIISFVAQIQTNTGEFRITNLSDSGYQLTGLQIQLGDNTMFDTSVLETSGLTDDGQLLEFTALAWAVLNQGVDATLAFTGFDPNDVFGFKTGFVDRLDGTIATGSDMNYAKVIATFTGGHVLESTFNGGPTSPSTSGRRSFVFTGSSEVEDPESLHSPEPASGALLLIGLGCLGMYRLRQRQEGERPE